MTDSVGATHGAILERGIVDLHFDLPMHLYEERDRGNTLSTEFLPNLETGGIGVIVAAIYLEDRYLPARAQEVALGQIACLQRGAGALPALRHLQIPFRNHESACGRQNRADHRHGRRRAARRRSRSLRNHFTNKGFV